MAKKRIDECGLAITFSVIGGKWKPLILWELSKGTLRYGQLKKLITGVTEKTLINQLKEMEFDGIIKRVAYPEVPPKVEYSISNLGIQLNEALLPLSKWGKEYEKKLKFNDIV